MRGPARVAVAAVLLLAGGNAGAACSVSAQNVAFPTYNPQAALPTDGSGLITVTCSALITLLQTYTIALSTGGSGGYTTRRMSLGGNQLQYNLYTNVLHTLVWGNGTGGSQTVQNTFLIGLIAVSANHTVYGRIPAGQNVAVGAYQDVITATVTY